MWLVMLESVHTGLGELCEVVSQVTLLRRMTHGRVWIRSVLLNLLLCWHQNGFVAATHLEKHLST